MHGIQIEVRDTQSAFMLQRARKAKTMRFTSIAGIDCTQSRYKSAGYATKRDLIGCIPFSP